MEREKKQEHTFSARPDFIKAAEKGFQQGLEDFLSNRNRPLLKDQIEELMNLSLTSRDIQVLQLRFGLKDGRSRTQGEVGGEISRSPRTVRRIEKSAIDKLRHSPKAKDLPDFLE